MFLNVLEIVLNVLEIVLNVFRNSSECFRNSSECFRNSPECFRNSSDCFRNSSGKGTMSSPKSLLKRPINLIKYILIILLESISWRFMPTAAEWPSKYGCQAALGEGHIRLGPERTTEAAAAMWLHHALCQVLQVPGCPGAADPQISVFCAILEVETEKLPDSWRNTHSSPTASLKSCGRLR